ncbi:MULTISPECIES: extracellular solute-binding protein [Paenibacillus]|jgi:putative aldouronate transport system substrate-binding protein|uniref:Extracellular solute-binding protein n=1 Tax=Paenibacillus baimaensis TaxID=2982185 RepID=A0ABT2UIN2_9BACL|nr:MULTISPECIES: extracellular solute-binding protein [unclassified Paenibacillus]MCU6794473.1 extracellular solute-binding protein [Paenibacillus sp. WQ 127069]OMF19343.1 ABC transporter substrate-binding protein [Paenibacillus sp. FSL H7-0331]
MKRWKKAGMLASLTCVTIVGCSSPAAPKAADNKPQGPVKISISMSDSLNKYALASTDINKDKWVKKLGELTNTELDIRLVPHAEFKPKTALMFASNDIPDVMNTIQGMFPEGPDMSGAIKGGLFMPLDDLLKEYGQDLLKAIPKEAWNEVKYNGKIYAIPEYLSSSTRRATFIRKDLLDQTGLPAPKTVDDLLNVLRAMKKNGVAEPFAFRKDFVYSDVIFGAYDVMPYSTMFEKIGDQVVPKFFKVEAMQKALQVYKTMYDEGLMAKDFASLDGNKWTNNINAGKSGVWNHNANLLLNWINTTKPANAKSEVIIIPSPVGDDGKGGMMKYSYTGGLSYINSKVSKEKAAAIVKFHNYMITEAGDRFFNFGIEGDTYTMKDGKVAYKQPTTPEGTLEEQFRSVMLRLVEDTALNRTLLNTTEDGKKLVQQFDTIVTKEGRNGIAFQPELAASAKYTDAGIKFSDMPPVILDHMLKMVYGKEPISDWPKVLEEWKSKGGNDIIKEATDRYNQKSGVIMGD